MKWCDFTCEHASFPKEAAVDGAGSCGTFSAVYCEKLNKLVHKNILCPLEREKKTQSPPAGCVSKTRNNLM